MTLKTSIVSSSLALGLLACGVTNSDTNLPTNLSANGEWITLFNGKDIKDWEVKIHHYDAGVNYGNTFRVEDGLLKVRYDQYDFTDEFGHIYYKTPFHNFHLTVDYRFSGEFEKGAPYYAELNSGVMFHSQPAHSVAKEQNWPISVEMQYLADTGDGKRTTGNMCSPGTDIIYNNKLFPEHCLNSNAKALPKDVWVTAELIVKGQLIQQFINGKKVLEYSAPSVGGYHKAVKGEDPSYWLPGKQLHSGYIALQSEGQPIEFKNIRIKNLK